MKKCRNHDAGFKARVALEAVKGDVDGLISAGRHERSGKRMTWRNDQDLRLPLNTFCGPQTRFDHVHHVAQAKRSKVYVHVF